MIVTLSNMFAIAVRKPSKSCGSQPRCVHKFMSLVKTRMRICYTSFNVGEESNLDMHGFVSLFQ